MVVCAVRDLVMFTIEEIEITASSQPEHYLYTNTDMAVYAEI